VAGPTVLSEIVASSIHSFSGGATLSQNVTIQEALSSNSVLSRDIADSASVVGGISGSFGYTRSVSDLITVGESVARISQYFRAQSRVLDFSESSFAYRQGNDFFGSLPESVSLVEQVDINIISWQPEVSGNHMAIYKRPPLTGLYQKPVTMVEVKR
jgi:hypothetical protein